MTANSPEKSRFWCFTLHPKSYDDGTVQSIPHELPEGARYCVYQLEKGKEGKDHYQGYIEFNDAVRGGQRTTWVKKFIPGAHTEIKYADRDQARHYCMKPCSQDCQQENCRKAREVGNGRIAWATTSPTELGVYGEIKQGTRTDIQKAVEDVTKGILPVDIVRDNPSLLHCYKQLNNYYDDIHTQSDFRKVETIVLWGDSGCGKTETAWKYDDKLYSKPEGDWFHKYRGQKTMLIDDFYGGIKYHEMLKILDKYPYDVPTKGSFVGAKWEKVYITSNKDPRHWYSQGLQENMIRRLHKVYYIQKCGSTNNWFIDDLRTNKKTYFKTLDIDGNEVDRIEFNGVTGEIITQQEFEEFIAKDKITDYYT